MGIFDVLFNNRQQKENEAQIAKIDALPLEEAKRQVDVFLRDAGKYRLSPLEGPLPDWVQGATREFFLTYGNVQGIKTETDLGLAHMGPSDYFPHLWRIGVDWDATELMLVPNSDQIYWADGFDIDKGMPQGDPEPSIYHHILHFEL